MLKVTQEMSLLSVGLKQEVLKMEQFHKNLVPLRSQKFKGVNLFCKYHVTPGALSEFVDFYSHGQSVVIFMISCGSYLLSSKMMAEFQDLYPKKNQNLQLFEDFIQRAKAIRDSLGINNKQSANAEKSAFLNCLIARIDRNDLKIEGTSEGPYSLASSLKGAFTVSGTFSEQLERSEKLVVFSPGLSGSLDENPYTGPKAKVLFEKESAEILNSLFLKAFQGPDLGADQSAILVEVDPNVIMEV